jgi:hypothetical protein
LRPTSSSGTVDQSTRRQGQLPKVNLSAAEKPIGRSRVYFGVNGETANLVLQERLDDPTTNHSLWRFDAFPTMRFPFSRLPYLTATAAGSWRLTHWLESKDPLTGVQSNIPLTRQLLDLRMNVTGPIVQRIFQTADNGYADRFKHVIRPTFNVRWLSPFDDFDNVVKFDQVDYEVGGTTTVNYGITNELMARRKRGEGRPPDSRTILTATVSQSYYTKAQAAQYDVYYQTGSAQKFSPLAIDVDARPADHFSSRFRMEIHPQARRPQLYSVSSMYDTARARFTGGWRKRPVILGVPGFELTAATHYLNANASLKLLDNRVGGSYGFDYDIKAAGFVQQRLIGYYNAQCCGISMDYQHAVINGVGQPNALKDRRFGISFTLAGIGSFANPFGAFGDNSGRR